MASRATDHGDEQIVASRATDHGGRCPCCAGSSEGTHFASFLVYCGIFFGALDGTQFLLCVVEGRWVALTPGVELPGVGPSGRAN